MTETTELIQKALGLRYIQTLTPGHSESQISLFEREGDKKKFVGKIPLTTDSQIDIENNLFGFKNITQTGLAAIVPNYYVVELDGKRILFIEYLGENLTEYSRSNEGLNVFIKIGDSIKNLIIKSLTNDHDGVFGQASIDDTIERINFFSNGLDETVKDSFIRNIGFLRIKSQSKKASLFLMDFTPDNIFLNHNSFNFIDPWRQSVYIGNTAISLGQFLTLSKDVYGLPHSKEGWNSIEKYLRNEYLEQIQSSEQFVIKMFKLGKLLQLILSAHARTESKPTECKLYSNLAMETLEDLISS